MWRSTGARVSMVDRCLLYGERDIRSYTMHGGQ